MMRSTWILVALGLAGCPYLGEDGYTRKVRDADGDGITAERFGGRDCDDGNARVGDCDLDRDGYRSIEVGGDDCDDTTASISPEAIEACNGYDDDCDGLIDNDDDAVVGPDVYLDEDGDGWGGTQSLTWCGEAPEGYVSRTRAGDCDDSDDSIAPGADERCDDVDHNCDGDPTAGSEDATFWYADTDHDGSGAGIAIAQGCTQPPGDVSDNDEDCAPNDPQVHPDAEEVPYDGIDNDCVDGDLLDVDGDGETAFFVGGSDCDDGDANVNANAIEACDGIDNNCDGAIDEGLILPWYDDADSDGAGGENGVPVFACNDAGPVGRVTNNDDCDDGNAAVNPAATEECDEIDNNCDGSIDGADATGSILRYADLDFDLFGDPSNAIEACPDALPTGTQWVDNNLDCDDTNAQAIPGGTETCDGVDNDCNGVVDDNASDAVLLYVDDDGDGFGDPTLPLFSCGVNDGLSRLPSDCDDTNSAIYPGAPEVCFDAVRQDCSNVPADDCDGDGFVDALDCEPENPDVHPDATEVCDGVDNDCDNDIDDADNDVDLSTVADWYPDDDGDGFAFGVAVAENTCTPPPGTSNILGDCDDDDSSSFPGAVEVCDDADNDCDGSTDEDAVDAPNWYIDADQDGYGEGLAVTQSCVAPYEGLSDNNDDCNDGFADVFPDAFEVCDGIDNNCDGTVDDADPDALLTQWFLDEDGDGHGDALESANACDQPSGYVPDNLDCDDANPDRSPSAPEVCDGLDNDCDGLTDGDDPNQTDTSIWFRDDDLDGFGDPTDAIVDCLRPNGYVDNDSDCNDADALVRPTAIETCDGQDNNCDGASDGPDAVDAALWFEDSDGDGWGNIMALIRSCAMPPDHVSLSGDCDDTDPTVRPGAIEVCDDGIDNDCNGLEDGNDPGQQTLVWYPDADGDGSGDAFATTTYTGCTPPPPDPYAISVTGWSTTNDDCDDADAAISPQALEVCDTVDNDCDGLTDSEDPSVDGSLYYYDADSDGAGVGFGAPRCEASPNWAPLPGDCDDTDPSRSPTIPEACNNIDDDCNGLTDDGVGTDLWVRDADGDGAFDVDNAVLACTVPAGGWEKLSSQPNDCDDGDPNQSPLMAEICDGKRNDCTAAAPDEGVGITWHVDADGDGFGDPAGPVVVQCSQPPGYAANDKDCQDVPAPGAPGVDPALVNPGRFLEFCNGADDDCDGTVDNDAIDAIDYYADLDSDGFGAGPTLRSCDTSLPAQTALLSGDCDDTTASIAPDLPEDCLTPADDNCNGLVNDNDPNVTNGADYFYDGDGDGHGRTTLSVHACAQPADFVLDSLDCNDATAAISPDAAEDCDGFDTDCVGGLDGTEQDVDGDGYLACLNYIERGAGFLDGNDCGANDPSRYPGAPEQCNELDDDCDAVIDNDLVEQDYWLDDDSDGFGDPNNPTNASCFQPPGYVNNQLDCDDSTNEIRPTASEIPGDNTDQNCDTVEDCYTDADNDNAPISLVNVGGDNNDADCNDANEGTQAELDALEDCDDTDGLTVAESTFYADCDGDGEATPTPITACGFAGADLQSPCAGGLPPDAWLATPGSDCNDGDNLATTYEDWYARCDNDAFYGATSLSACGVSDAIAQFTCDPDPQRYTTSPGQLDCDDTDGQIYPGAAEVVGNGIDEDCDNTERCYLDQDDDGARSTSVKPENTPIGDLICDGYQEATAVDPMDCDDLDPTGQNFENWWGDCDADSVFADPPALAVCGENGAELVLGCVSQTAVYTQTPGALRDCDDNNPARFPGATEVVADNVDQDCDSKEICFDNVDGDPARHATNTHETALFITDCSGANDGAASDPIDCNDADPLVFPSAPELPGDGVDQNCNNRETCFLDFDNDGARSTATKPGQTPFGDLICDAYQEGQDADLIDCVDTDASVYPGAFEVVGDGIDQDCDTQEECYQDDDGDTFRSAIIITSADPDCDDIGEALAGASLDCNDFDFAGTITEAWFADCDNDSFFGATASSACGPNDANAQFTAICIQSTFPITTSTPTPADCDDTDGLAFVFEDWYADQDFDTHYGYTSWNACGTNGANAAAGLSLPPAQWSTSTAPTDCDDLDYAVFAEFPWFANEDGDAAFGLGAWLACDVAGANAASGLSLLPGQWTTTAPRFPDCNDQDSTATMLEFFYPDCDGDTVFASFSTYNQYCGAADANANALMTCFDFAPPDGGWDTLSGTDCNDENGAANQLLTWYPDCDLDGSFDYLGIPACGIDEANYFLGQCPNKPLLVDDWVNTFPLVGTEDCDDSDDTNSPLLSEVCDGKDNNCDFLLDSNELDEDADGWLLCAPYIDNGEPLNGGGDCVDNSIDPDAPYFHPGQNVDMLLLYNTDLQMNIDKLCGDGTIFLDPFQNYTSVTLPATKAVTLDGTGGATFDDLNVDLITAVGTPVGTTLRNIVFLPWNAASVTASGGNVTIEGASFLGGTEVDGQGIVANDSDVSCDNCFFNDLAGLTGSAVRAENNATVTISNSDVNYCVDDGDAAVHATGSQLTITDTNFLGNDLLFSGQAATSITASGGITTLERVDVALGISTDRQPAVHLSGTTALLTDVSLRDNPGGLWVTGGSNVVATRLTLDRIEGRNDFGNYEGAIELRDNTTSLSLFNGEIFSTKAPGIHVDDQATLDVAYSTIVRNDTVGILMDGTNTDLSLHHTVIYDNPIDVTITAAYTPSPGNNDNFFQYVGSPAQLCALPATCSTGAPAFRTYDPKLVADNVLLRPVQAGNLWGQPDLVGDALFDADKIIGHSGGPDGDAVAWHGSTDGDLLPDGWEQHWFGDLTSVNDGSFIGDTDTWDAITEFTNGTCPIDFDTDRDLFDDGYEGFPLDCGMPSFNCPAL